MKELRQYEVFIILTITNCLVRDVYDGIYVNSTYTATVKDNYVYNVGNIGIYGREFYGLILNNRINTASFVGIYIRNGKGQSVVNIITDCLYAGIYIDIASYWVIFGNILSNTVDNSYGIAFIEGDHNIAILNSVSNSDIGIQFSNATSDSITGLNKIDNIITKEYDNLGTNNYLFGDDTAYAASWNGDLGTPTKNAVYDIIKTTIDDLNGFPDELKNLVTAEIQQLENIDATTISAAQWGYLGSMSAQPLENVVEDLSPQLGANLDAQSTYKVVNLIDPVDNQDSATKKWVDDHNWTEADITDLGSYLENIVEDLSPQLGGNLDAQNLYKINNLVDPVANQDAATKAYSDGKISNTAFAASWSGVSTIAPSKDAVYDVLSLENYIEWDDDDPASFDISIGDLTIDGSYHECDFDSYKTVPSGTIGFFARVRIRSNSVGDNFTVRASSQSNQYQVSDLKCQVSTLPIVGLMFIPLDSNHIFDYQGDSTLTLLDIIALAWVIGH